MLTLHDYEPNINFQNLIFIWAEYDKVLGEKNPQTSNGMCWKAPGELKIFQEITCNYGKSPSDPNALILGKTTAKLVPIDRLAEYRDVYILDYMTDVDTNEKVSILYEVNSSKEIIDEEITDQTDVNYYLLDSKLEELTTDRAVFIIGGASVYKYFLTRFPLMYGFISEINSNKVNWLGSKPMGKLGVHPHSQYSDSELLRAPVLTQHNRDGIYAKNDYFTTYLRKPSQYLVQDVYNHIKTQSDLLDFSQFKSSTIEVDVSVYEIPGFITLKTEDDIVYYISKVYVDETAKILKSPKVFIEKYHKYDDVHDLESQVYYILHDTENYVFLFRK